MTIRQKRKQRKDNNDSGACIWYNKFSSNILVVSACGSLGEMKTKPTFLFDCVFKQYSSINIYIYISLYCYIVVCTYGRISGLPSTFVIPYTRTYKNLILFVDSSHMCPCPQVLFYSTTAAAYDNRSTCVSSYDLFRSVYRAL